VHSRRITVMLAVAIPVVGLMTMASPSSATPVSATGSVTCSYGTTFSFSPALKPGRGKVVPAGTKEVITIAPATLGSCTGTATSGTVPTSGLGTKSITVTMPAIVENNIWHAGGCDSLATFAPKLNAKTNTAKFDWTPSSDGVTKAPVTAVSPLGGGGPSPYYYDFSGTAKGSFNGPVSIDAVFDSASSTELMDCIGNVAGSPHISTLTVDPTQSSIALAG